VCKNRVLRRIFGPAREDVTRGGWTELRNDEPYNLYSSPNIISHQIKEN